MSLIRIRELFKIYTQGKLIKTHALRGVTLDVEEGAFVSIAGSSGSGKTTLLNLIGAIDKPSSGSIHYGDTDITNIPLNKLAEFRLRSIGFVFQAYNLINTLTAVENTEYIMLLQGVPSVERRRRAENALDAVGLHDMHNRRPSQMSGGQQQRVAVARAIVGEPSVILADEPTANLDSTTSENLLDLMKKLNQEKRISFIFSTHDQMVMSKADKVIHIKDGIIE